MVLYLLVRPYKEDICGIKEEDKKFTEKSKELWLTGLHKVGVGPSPQSAEQEVQPQSLPDADTAAAVVGPHQQLQPKQVICVSYPNQIIMSYLHPGVGLLVVWVAISHPCLHLEQLSKY